MNNTHCSKKKTGQLLWHPTNGGELEKYWLLWSWRHFQWPRVQHLVIPRKIWILSWACNTCRARSKKLIFRNNMPVVHRNQVVLTFLTNLAGMIFEHLEEKLAHCASLAVWTQYREGGRTQWPRASCKFGEKQMLRERSKSWPQSPPFQGY